MSIGIYCRISKNKEVGKDVSISVQKKHGIEFAHAMNLDYKVYVDEGISGATDKISDRPAFTKLITGIENGEIDIIYCYDQSRIERNNKIWNLFVSIITEKKCKYFPGGRHLDLDVPENQFFSGIMSLANELYAAKTGIKVKEAIYENAKKGKTHGLVAYGYKKGANGYMEIDEYEATIVKRIFELSLNGTGAYTIAKILNREAVPTKFNHFKGEIKRVDKYTKQVTTYKKNKVKWRGNVVHDIIRNSIYKGEREWQNEIVPAPIIVDKELWELVNSNLDKNKKKAGKRVEYHYLLNGILFCGHCGSKILGKKRLKGNDNAYKCQGKTQHKITCKSRGISLPKLESFIIQHLFISRNLQTFLENVSDSTDDLDLFSEKLNTTKNELDKNLKAEQKTYDLLTDPDFEEDINLKERLKKIKQKIRSLNETIDILENKIIERKSGSRKERLLNQTKNVELSQGFDKIKELVHSILKKVTLEHFIDSKGKGFYFVKVEYKGFDEFNIFKTDWNAMEWKWVVQRTETEDLFKDDVKIGDHYFVQQPKSVIVLKREELFITD